MFIPDETHAKLSQAEFRLVDTTEALAQAKWVSDAIAFLTTAMDLDDPEAVAFALKRISDNRERFSKLKTAIVVGNEAVRAAQSALMFARSKIPNTTPPDPSGYESCPSLAP